MRKQKKGKKGEVTLYISRTRAVRKLQISLADFRRLCILKGIYPREPKDKKRVNKGSTAPRTYYGAKDIAFLAHEPLLNKFREFKVFARKLRKALGKRQVSIADSLRENKPTVTLDHLVKERCACIHIRRRLHTNYSILLFPLFPFFASLSSSTRYPTFIDAVQDLDDALCMVYLFARMPKVGHIAPAFLSNISRLAAEFLNYVVVTHSLRKVFLSIKGAHPTHLLTLPPHAHIDP